MEPSEKLSDRVRKLTYVNLQRKFHRTLIIMECSIHYWFQVGQHNLAPLSLFRYQRNQAIINCTVVSRRSGSQNGRS